MPCIAGANMRRIGVAVVFAVFLSFGGARADILVSISKSQQKLSVTVDGEEAFRWPVSTGRKGHTTPSGTFHPERLERHWYSHKYENAPMPWAVFFHRGYAMHGTTEAYNLGHVASHGCVRLRPDHAATLFSLVRHEGARHTQIVVSDKPLPPLRRAPGNVPVAEHDSQTRTAAAEHRDENEFLRARRHLVHQAHEALAQAEAAPLRRLHVRTAGHDEAWLRRDTDAWLRNIDRKYGMLR